MRKTIYLTCLFISVLTCMTARSQEITLNRDGASLQDLFLEIHHQTGYFFYYSNKDLSGAKPVSIHVNKAPLEEVLNLCFAGQPLVYKLNNKTIVVQRKQGEKTALTDAKGKVLNEQGEPVESASVEVQATRQATSTNSEGEFSLEKVPEQSMLVFSHVGFQSQTISLHKSGYLTVILKRSISKLDEVQVIAYGTTTQRLTTGNASKVSSAEISQQPVSDPLAAMSGRMPGVYIQQASGIPGGAFSVEIRGRNSVRSDGNNPLYIVDGVQFSSTTLDNPYTTTGGVQSSPLNNLNPSDIESIEVLKDADATAIYGSRGANGVVLITTKTGKAGKTRVDLAYLTGIEQITRRMDLLNTPQYLEMRREAFLQDGLIPDVSNAPDLLLWDTTRYTDWQKELMGQTAHRTTVNASVSGGNSHTQFLLGGEYSGESTVIPGDFSDRKGSFHLSLNNSSEDEKFTTRLLFNYINDYRFQPQSSVIIPVMLSPDAPSVYDSTGALNWASSTWINPASYFLQTNLGKTNNLIANLTLAYKILPGLELKSSLGYNSMDLNQVALNPLASYNPAYGLTSGSAHFSDNKTSSWVAEPEVSFLQKIAKGNLHFQLGGTLQQNTQTALDQLGVGFSSDKQLNNLQNASTVIVLNSAVTDYHYVGLFSRLSFNWLDKYLLNLTARRDGSSRFGPGKQFGNFGALGLGWIFTKESWFSNHLTWISFGKIRGSYGTAGNDQIPDYGYLDTYQSNGFVYQGISAMTPQSLANPDYSWETIRKSELGLQTGFFKDHLLINISYYQNRSSDQLVGYSLPVITGFNSVIANLPATVQNNGWEIECNTVNLRNNQFSWTSTANITIPRNRLIAYSNLAGSSYANSYVVGQSLYIAKVYQYQGIDPQTGVYTFRDYDKDGVISYPNDAQYVQKTGYDFYGGIGNTISYKAFQLNLFVQFVRQVNINYTSNFLMPGSLIYSAIDNQPTEVLNRWQSPDKTGKTERFTQDFSSAAGLAYSNYQFSNRDYTNASFIRLKNISVSYIFPLSLLNSCHLKEAKINLQFQNLFTFTHYPGFDPETGTGLPPLKTIVAGIQVSL